MFERITLTAKNFTILNNKIAGINRKGHEVYEILLETFNGFTVIATISIDDKQGTPYQITIKLNN